MTTIFYLLHLGTWSPQNTVTPRRRASLFTENKKQIKTFNSPFSSSLWPLNWRSEDAFFTASASIWSNIFTNSNEKKTCLLLCLLCTFKFQTLTCQNFWIFYFTSRLTLYECVVNVYIQRQFLIRNWTIERQTKAMFRVYRIDFRGATRSYPV